MATPKSGEPEKQGIDPHLDATFVEVGNTTIKIAHPTPDGRWIIERVARLQGAITRVKRRSPSEPILLAPVAEERGEELALLLRSEGFEPTTISRATFSDFLAGSYDTPETLGLDRILNLVGLRGEGVVISCGTCITVDLLYDRRPWFGAILPGYSTAAKGMAQAVPALPKARLDGTFTIPSLTSQNSVNLGILLGTTEAALGIARRLIRSAGAPDDNALPLVLTGGGAGIMLEVIRMTGGAEGKEVVSVPGLVFEGMRGADNR